MITLINENIINHFYNKGISFKYLILGKYTKDRTSFS